MRQLKYILLFLCMCAAVFFVGCEKGEQQESPKVLSGSEIVFEQPWDYAVLSEKSSSDFWVATTVSSDYRSDEFGRRAGTIYAGTDGNEMYVFVDKDASSSKTATIYFVGFKGEERSLRTYDTGHFFEGANHSASIKLIYKTGVYYVSIDGEWIKIDKTTAAASSEGTFDFFTEQPRFFGVGNAETGVSSHKNISGGSDVDEQLKDCLLRLTLDCSEGGTAELSASEVMSGEQVTLKITPKDESYTPVVTYNGEALVETEKNVYVFEAKASGTISVRFEMSYLVTGKYLYETGLFSAGDTVTVRSSDTGIIGTASEGEFSIRLPDGTHRLVLSSNRFSEVEMEVKVSGGDVTIEDALVFTQIAFTDGTYLDNTGSGLLKNGEYKQFNGASLKNFYVEADVERMDEGESVAGIYFYAGSASPAKVFVFENQDTHMFKIRITRGTGWDDRSDRDYETAIPYKAACRLSVMVYGEAIYVGIDDNWTKIVRDTAYGSPVDNTDFDAATVWNAEQEKTFGIYANGSWSDGFPVENVRYGEADQTTIDNTCYAQLTVACKTEGISAQLSEEHVLKGQDVTLTVSGAEEGYIVKVTYNGKEIAASAANEYRITVTENGTVEVSAEAGAYTITGRYSYESGLYATGDIVTVRSSDTGIIGTASEGEFSIRLPDGTHRLVLSSNRFSEVEMEVKVSGGDVTIEDALVFTQIAFTDGTYLDNTGSGLLKNGEYKQFNGASLKNFYVEADVERMDEGESVAGIYFYAGSASPAKVFVFENQDTHMFKIRITRGTGWDDRSDRDYETAIPYKAACRLSVMVYGEAIYVGIDDNWTKIVRDTAYGSPVDNTDFDAATVWNAEQEKTFGIFVNGSCDEGFPVKNVRYGEADQTTVDGCYAQLTVSKTEGISAQLSAERVLKGQNVTLTVSGAEEDHIVIVTYNGEALVETEKNVYVFEAKASGTISVRFEMSYLVTGKYLYETGLFSAGDTVTVRSSDTGIIGTASEGEFSIRLPDGTHRLVLSSNRFSEVEMEVKVSGGDVTIEDALVFTQIAFTDGTYLDNTGSGLLKNGEYKQFNGASLKNFYVEADVERMDEGESVAGIYFYAGSASPAKVFVFENQDTHMFKIRITRGTGWDDRSDRDYETAIPYKAACRLSVMVYGEAIYVGIDDNWTKIVSDTAYVPNVNNTDFDAATVWNAEQEKTFGIFANGSCSDGFPVENVRYGEANQTLADKIEEALQA